MSDEALDVHGNRYVLYQGRWLHKKDGVPLLRHGKPVKVRLVDTIREPLRRLIRVINAEPTPGPDFPGQWAAALREVEMTPITLAIAIKAVP